MEKQTGLILLDTGVVNSRKLLPQAFKHHPIPELINLDACVVETSLPSAEPVQQQQLQAQDSQIEQGSQHSGGEEEASEEQVKMKRDQKFQRQIQVNVYLEGIKRFLLHKGHYNHKTEDLFDKSQLKRLIIPYEYNAPSRSTQK
jgi:hypothetical protein